MSVRISVLDFTLNMLLSHSPPHLHLTTSKVMVIVWRLRGNIVADAL